MTAERKVSVLVSKGLIKGKFIEFAELVRTPTGLILSQTDVIVAILGVP